MTKEEKYENELKELGIWKPAFQSTVHDLSVLEREQARTRKAWKRTAENGESPSVLDPHYAVILRQEKMIQDLRETLGLTPKALRRVKGAIGCEDAGTRKRPKTVLEIVRERNKAG